MVRSNSTSDQNFKPTIVAVDSTDTTKTVAIEGDPTNGALLVEVVSGGSGGGSDVQYTDGASAVAHPIGTIPVFNNAGTITAVSAANPLPVSATISTAGIATSTKQSDGSQKTQIVDGSGNVIASTSNALNTSTNITNSSLPVTGTFFQATQPVSASSLPLPTGAATSANQSTEITSLATIAALSKAEDAPHTSGDTGVPMWAVRNDTGAVFAGSDGDYIPFATDATGALRVDLNGTVSTNNSTISVLSANAVFTGISEDALNYNEIRISVISSHVSATDGLSIQQSEDNTNWDFTDTYTIAAATGKTYSVPRQARYFRVVYTNGATLQTSFRLQVLLNRLGTKSSSQRASDSYTNETDLEEVWAFGGVYDTATNTWSRTSSGNGTTGLGTTRVTLSSDSTGQVKLAAGAAAIGSITNTSFIATQATAANLNATVVGTGTFVTQSTLAAETTKVIGVVRNADGSGNLLTSTTNALDVNIKSSITQSTNTAQVNGNTTLTGNGTTGTGSQRVTIASDNTVLPAVGAGATAAAPPANAAYTGLIAKTANPSAASDGNLVGALADKLGKQVVVGSIRDLKGDASLTLTASTSETTLIAQVASTFLDVYGMIVVNTSATASEVVFRDTTGGTARFSIYVPAGETRGFMLPESGAYKQATVNTNWTAQAGTSVSSIKISALYVKNI